MRVKESMAHHKALISWESNGADFASGRYSRAHTWEFDGGAIVEGSSSPQVVPLPMSVEAGVDPEEAFVASISSCHMLSFLYEAWKMKFEVRSYRDEAVGTLEKSEEGRKAITRVELHPNTQFGERAPSAEELKHLHHLSHEACYIANSVKTIITVEGTLS